MIIFKKNNSKGKDQNKQGSKNQEQENKTH